VIGCAVAVADPPDHAHVLGAETAGRRSRSANEVARIECPVKIGIRVL
jgi:hypothetical protein